MAKVIDLGQGAKMYMTSAKEANQQTLMDYATRLRSLALAMFKYENVPETVSIRHLESVLYDQGRALFFEDPNFGYMALGCTPSGQLNHYNEPIRYTAISTTYKEEYAAENCVLIRNNYSALPTSHTIDLFAQRLAIVERITDVNINAQKTPIIILCDEQQRLTLKNLYNQYEGNVPFIFADKMMNLDNIKTINTGAPYLADKLTVQKHAIWDDAMTFLGQQNANTDKRERLVTNEVDANNQMVQLSAEVMLLSRREAIDEINRKFGLNMKVDLRVKQDAELEEPEQDDAEDPEGRW